MLVSPMLFAVTLSAAAGAEDPLPLAFVENRGQWDARVRYAATRADTTAFLTDEGLRLQLARFDREDDRVEGVNLFLTFEGASPDVRVGGRERFRAERAFFRGNDSAHWVTGVPSFAAVRYAGLLPGVDLGVREQQGWLAYDVLLAPGADPGLVVVRCEGADSLAIEPDGSLALATSLGTVRQSPPVTWHVLPSGERRPVESRFRIVDDKRYGFEVDGIDPDLDLVIDPGLEWSTYLGGSGHDVVSAFAQDESGVVTVAGTTLSGNFPTTSGAFDETHNSASFAKDAFVTRLDPSQSGANQMLWSTFLGGGGTDQVWDVALGPSGKVHVVGHTKSSNFPTTSAAYATTISGDHDGFVVVLDSSGAQLVHSTFLGGPKREEIVTLDVDDAGVVTVAGWTRSAGFPVTNGTTWSGGASTGDAFVAQFDSSLSQLVYSTFLGDTGDDVIWDLARKSSGSVVVAGKTSSPGFPTTTGAWDTSYNGGGNDAFVACIDPGQDLVVWSTFLGGDGLDEINPLVLDDAGRPIVGGWTSSTDFPTTAFAYDATHNGGSCFGGPAYDAWVARLDESGSALEYLTYLGGACDEGINGLAVDAGMVTVTGSVGSFDFPTTAGAYDTTFNGGGSGSAGPYDAFVARLDPSLSGADQLLYSTFLGGAGHYDYPYFSVALDATGAATVGGETQSTDFPTTASAYDATWNGDQDGFLTRLDMLPVGAEKRGWSTPGCDGPLAVGVTGIPQIGNASFALTCTHAPANTTGFLFLGASCVTNPVYGSGVALFFDTNQPFLMLGVGSGGDGVARVPAPIPDGQALVGLGACVQFAWPDACAPAGWSGSNALKVTVQP